MASAINDILEKCDIYFDNSLISKESILEKYLSFFADSMDPETRTVGFALHTGSICFDVISVVAVGLGCLSYNLSTNDEIIASLQPDEIVMYESQRYRWKGLEKINDDIWMCLEQDGKDGPSKKLLKYDCHKHHIIPYHGLSQVTDGRGIPKIKTNREDFLSYIFNLPVFEIPTQIDISVVAIAERGLFADICKKTSIVYGGGKRVGLLDIIPASYYTSGRIEHQFGANPTKSEPVFKVTGNISVARDMIFDKHGNKVVGLLVSDDKIMRDGTSGLSDLLRRKKLKFALVMSPIHAELSNHIFELYEDATVFACTKEYLTTSPNIIGFSNPYTEELYHQIQNIVDNTVTCIKVNGGFGKDIYDNIRNAIYTINLSNWESELKDEFIISSHSILSLLNTAVFTMSEMEQAIVESKINPSVRSPKARIAELWNLAKTAGTMQELCQFVANALEQKYNELLAISPKAEILREYIGDHSTESIVIVVPKAYYADILMGSIPEVFAISNILCVTQNKFDPCVEYDAIIVVGDVHNKKFDPLYCLTSKNIVIFLYDCEERFLEYRSRQKQKYERYLNFKQGINTKKWNDVYNSDDNDENIETEIQRLAMLDEYIYSRNVFDVRNIAVDNTQIGISVPIAEVTHVGAFTTGEQIFFSKFYSAVVFDAVAGKVTEKTPSELAAGDVVVFTKRNDYTQNIVDIVYERLLKSGRLSSRSIEMFEKSQYWKKVLREYKEIQNYSYRDVAKQLSAVGCAVQEVSIRQWLIEDSHIVGPRNDKTLEYIGKITQNKNLLEDAQGYYKACQIIRHERRKILKLIAKAINDKLLGAVPQQGSELEIVYENVEKLSETLELEYISDLDKSVNVNINLVNRPITEAEVLM